MKRRELEEMARDIRKELSSEYFQRAVDHIRNVIMVMDPDFPEHYQDLVQAAMNFEEDFEEEWCSNDLFFEEDKQLKDCIIELHQLTGAPYHVCHDHSTMILRSVWNAVVNDLYETRQDVLKRMLKEFEDQPYECPKVDCVGAPHEFSEETKQKMQEWWENDRMPVLDEPEVRKIFQD